MQTSWKGKQVLKRAFLQRKELWVRWFYTNGNRLWHEDVSQTLDHLQTAQMLLFASFGTYITAMVWKLMLLERKHKLNKMRPLTQPKKLKFSKKQPRPFKIFIYRSLSQGLHTFWVQKWEKPWYSLQSREEVSIWRLWPPRWTVPVSYTWKLCPLTHW